MGLSFARTTAPGRFGPTVPVRVHLVWAEPVPADFAHAGPVLGASERAGSLHAHFVQTCAFAWAAQALGHFPRPMLRHLARPVLEHLVQPVLRHLVRAVQAQPVLAHLSRPPTLGIASTGLRLMVR